MLKTGGSNGYAYFSSAGGGGCYIHSMHHLHSKSWLAAEVLLLMVGVPTLLYYTLPMKFMLPAIWLAALCCHLGYRGLTAHTFSQWWLRKAFTAANLKPILLRFLISAGLLWTATYMLEPGSLFSFVRTSPRFWLLVMFLYPILSVVPQEIIFRSFFFARYRTLFTHPAALVLASGLAFGFAHILFHNWVAPVLCVVGGIMFAQTYRRTQSLMLVAFEHALYGDFVFTLGLGRYFYHGAVAAAH